MTILNATVTTDRAYLCQDTLAWDRSGRPIGEMRKWIGLPAVNAALGVSGTIATRAALASAVERIRVPTLAGLVSVLPGVVRGLAPAGETLRVVLVGVDARGPAGVVVASDHDFEAQDPSAGGHVVSPAPDPLGLDVTCRWRSAAQGSDVPGFYRALVAAQAAAYPLSTGDTAELVTITRTGLTVETIRTRPHAQNAGEIFRRWAPVA